MKPQRARYKYGRESLDSYADRLKAWQKGEDICERERQDRHLAQGHGRLYRDLRERIEALERRSRELWLEMTEEQRRGLEQPSQPTEWPVQPDEPFRLQIY